MKKAYQILLLCLVMSVSPLLWAQQHNLTDSLQSRFKRYQSGVLQEKLFVHIDRTSYLAGELLWFKIYYVDAYHYKALDISRVAYVEILDKNNDAVVQSKVALRDGTGNGSLFIPATLGNGTYVFRAYTHWMKNFSADLYFHQPITIINTFVKTEQEAEINPNPTFHAAFYPEGGHLVAGIRSKIAFKVTDQSGSGISFKGTVINSAGKVVTEFVPLKFGIGSFYFTADPGETYSIVIEDTGNKKITFPFPDIQDSGYSMSVVERPDHLEIDVFTRSINSPIAILFVHSKQHITKAEGKYLNNNHTQFVVDKKDLDEGISKLTLFNSEFRPLCERLYFKRPEKKLEIKVRTERKSYEPRNLVRFNLSGNKSADVSISVYRTDSIPAPERHNILEYLWLSSELSGAIESPEYYFNTYDSIANRAWDNLMLTHGWRRFKWSDMLSSNSSFKYSPEYRGHIIQGTVTNRANIPIPGLLATLSSPAKNFHLYGSQSNTEGKLLFEVRAFFGQHSIYVQPLVPNNDIEIKINDPFSKYFAQLNFPPLALNSALRKTILDRSIAMQVHHTYYQEHLSALHKPAGTPLPFYGTPDESYRLDDYTRFPQLEEVFKEYVRGVMVRKRKEGIQFMVQQKINEPIANESPVVLLDGVPVFDYDKLLEMDPARIEKIDVITHPYFLGPLTFYGAIILSTYGGDLGGFEINPEGVSLNYEGLQAMREFYSPTYETQSARDSRIPDYRSLLYWNPSLTLSDQNASQIQFYTSDITGQFEVVIEGISKDGTAGSTVYHFAVD
ncbi:MAG: hypothetical protein DYG99_00640 [Bacteroidetes bacterium CHB5]|nr:hypothetical protein [Bacteroidetes bacterium CHB5]